MAQFVNTVSNRLFSLDVFGGLIMFLPIAEAAVSMKALPNLPKLPRAMERPYKDSTNLCKASFFWNFAQPFSDGGPTDPFVLMRDYPVFGQAQYVY